MRHSTGVVILADIEAAAERIRPFVVRTPLERSPALSRNCEADVWLKFECFQATGSFKVRGALNALLQLDGASRVVTASAGNHGLGVARAAAVLGVSATVVLPETASPAKIDALRQARVELILTGDTYDEAEAAAHDLARERGLDFISPYNDPRVIAGAGTIALEVLQDLPEARVLVVPVGGGGLIGGVGLAVHALNPEAAVYGAQSEASPAMQAALAHGHIVPVEVRPSLADGLAGNIESDSVTLQLAQRYVRQVALVTEPEIADAMGWLVEHEHALVEGSAAVGVAALLTRRLVVDGPTVVLLTGRNVTLSGGRFSTLLTPHVAAS